MDPQEVGDLENFLDNGSSDNSAQTEKSPEDQNNDGQNKNDKNKRKKEKTEYFSPKQWFEIASDKLNKNYQSGRLELSEEVRKLFDSMQCIGCTNPFNDPPKPNTNN